MNTKPRKAASIREADPAPSYLLLVPGADGQNIVARHVIAGQRLAENPAALAQFHEAAASISALTAHNPPAKTSSH